MLPGTFMKLLGHSLLSLCAVLAVGAVQAAPVVHTTDFINNTQRTQFNSFESIPNDGTMYTGSGAYTEGGITVQQINPSQMGIWVTHNPGGRDGSRAWYPNGGDFGYTSLSLSSGLDFGDVGFAIGSGNSTHNHAYFELWDDGALVLAGSVAHMTGFHYLGFEGGGFDTILLRDGVAGRSLHDGTHNALAIDAIELRASQQVPEPASMALAALGLAGLGIMRRKTQA